MLLISDLQISTILSVAGPLIVGATFLYSGAIKAVSPHVFRQHLSNLGWIPRRYLDVSVVAAAALEAAWGIMLVTNAIPRVVVPLTAIALLVLTGISWWGVKAGRTTDCGCFGGYVVPSLAQSILLNSVFILLLLVTPLPRESHLVWWKMVAAILVGGAAGSLAVASQRALAKTGEFLFDLSPLKVDRRWHDRWGTQVGDTGEFLVSYLGPDCPHCKQWVRVLNAVSQSRGLPQVVGIVATPDERLRQFVEESGIRFPMKTIPQTLMSRLVWGVPTTVLVADGKIQNQWSGRMPPEFFARFRDAFFPGEAPEKSLEPIRAGS
jgi:hypothetical protein